MNVRDLPFVNERGARTASPTLLRAQLQDPRRDVAAIARRELTRREREASETASLTGVVEPL